jgi:hypothetical protein
VARAWQIEAERLAAVNPALRGMQLGDFEYVPDALRLGAQRGNRFEVTLRCACAHIPCLHVLHACASERMAHGVGSLRSMALQMLAEAQLQLRQLESVNRSCCAYQRSSNPARAQGKAALSEGSPMREPGCSAGGCQGAVRQPATYRTVLC